MSNCDLDVHPLSFHSASILIRCSVCQERLETDFESFCLKCKRYLPEENTSTPTATTAASILMGVPCPTPFPFLPITVMAFAIPLQRYGHLPPPCNSLPRLESPTISIAPPSVQGNSRSMPLRHAISRWAWGGGGRAILMGRTVFQLIIHKSYLWVIYLWVTFCIFAPDLQHIIILSWQE